MKLAHSTSRILRQRYELHELVGSGASGQVYEATDLLLDRRVAIKCMGVSERRPFSPRSADAFVLEAQTLAQVKHPHIVEIYDVGRDDLGVPFFVMELLTETLGRLLAKHASLSPEQTLSLLLPLCGALACAHDRGILHCDLKPENIMVQRVHERALRGKLLDFGIARRTTGPVVRDVVYGTPGYVAPEQASGVGAAPCSDVWALGVVAFRCLGGCLPFGRETGLRLLERTVEEDMPSLGSVSCGVPDPIVRAIDRALERAPERRYADMRSFARGLVSAALQAGISVASDPDPVGLPEASEWYRASFVETECMRPVARSLSVCSAQDASIASKPSRHWFAGFGSILAVALCTFAVGGMRPTTPLPRDVSQAGGLALSARAIEGAAGMLELPQVSPAERTVQTTTEVAPPHPTDANAPDLTSGRPSVQLARTQRRSAGHPHAEPHAEVSKSSSESQGLTLKRNWQW